MRLPHAHSIHPSIAVAATRAPGGRRRVAAAVAALCVLIGASAAAGTSEARDWVLDPVHTRVLFAVSHAGLSQALGTVSGSEGRLQFDPDDWSRTRLEASVPLQRLELGDAGWNRAALAPRLLDAQAHPVARFISDRAVATGPGQGHVCGALSLHGVTRPLCMDVTVNAIKRHPMPPFRRTAGFSATATLLRSDYGIDAWPTMIGDEVTIRIEAEAVRAPGAAFPDDPPQASPSAPDPEPETRP